MTARINWSAGVQWECFVGAPSWSDIHVKLWHPARFSSAPKCCHQEYIRTSWRETPLITWISDQDRAPTTHSHSTPALQLILAVTLNVRNDISHLFLLFLSITRPTFYQFIIRLLPILLFLSFSPFHSFPSSFLSSFPPLQAMMLRGDIEEAKRTRNALQKKLKEEGATHNAEKRQLQVNPLLTLLSFSFLPLYLFLLLFFSISLYLYFPYIFQYLLSHFFIFFLFPSNILRFPSSFLTSYLCSYFYHN